MKSALTASRWSPGRRASLILVSFMRLFGAVGAEPTPDENLAGARAALAVGRWMQAEDLVAKVLSHDTNNVEAYALRGQARAFRLDATNALSDFDRVLQLNPNFAQAYQWRGAERFKLGRIEESITDFDEFIRRAPDQAPHHWQRGIAYYYAGRYEDGRRQFELHQTVNPQDVENAVWHFLCVAAVSGLPRAREQFITITRDTRVPMGEVHRLFAGTGSVDDVWKAVNASQLTKEQKRSGEFYAHLYLGLYYEAKKESALAREQIVNAAEQSAGQGYMGAVARVHASRLRDNEPKR